MIKISSVEKNCASQAAPDAIQVQAGKFFPLCEDKQSIGVLGGGVCIDGKIDSGSQNLLGASHGRGIVSLDAASFAEQRIHDLDCRRFADIVSPALESQAQHPQSLAGE